MTAFARENRQGAGSPFNQMGRRDYVPAASGCSVDGLDREFASVRKARMACGVPEPSQAFEAASARDSSRTGLDVQSMQRLKKCSEVRGFSAVSQAVSQGDGKPTGRSPAGHRPVIRPFAPGLAGSPPGPRLCPRHRARQQSGYHRPWSFNEAALCPLCGAVWFRAVRSSWLYTFMQPTEGPDQSSRGLDERARLCH
jgi:hypothetical protein